MSDFRVESVSAPAADGSTIHPATTCKIKVLGVGGGGGNSLQHMINASLSGVEFIAINTDSQALSKCTSPTRMQIGVKLTQGLGAGCDPNKGRKAAEESKDAIKKELQGSDMVFITAGMGGGTGTGAAPIIAEIAKETGALTVAVVTRPFHFEGKRHMINAEGGITELSKHVDSLIVIDNDKLLKNLGDSASIVSAFNAANDVLLNAVRGITDSITNAGYINLDFADVQTVMRGRGHAMIGNGMGEGANFVEDAVVHAIHSPLIEQADIQSAAGLLVNVRVNPNFPIVKWEEICKAVQAYADEEADCKFGMTFDDSVNENQIYLTILITGISATDSGTRNSVVSAPKNFYNPGKEPLGARGAYMNPESAAGQPAHVTPLNLGANSVPAAPRAEPAAAAPEPFRAQTPSEVTVPGAAGRDDGADMFVELPPILRNKSV